MSVFICIAENTKEILVDPHARERESWTNIKMPASGDSTNTAQLGDWTYFYREFPSTFCSGVQSDTAAWSYLAHQKAKAPLANVKLQRGCLNSLHVSQIGKQQAIHVGRFFGIAFGTKIKCHAKISPIQHEGQPWTSVMLIHPMMKPCHLVH